MINKSSQSETQLTDLSENLGSAREIRTIEHWQWQGPDRWDHSGKTDGTRANAPRQNQSFAHEIPMKRENMMSKSEMEDHYRRIREARRRELDQAIQGLLEQISAIGIQDASETVADAEALTIRSSSDNDPGPRIMTDDSSLTIPSLKLEDDVPLGLAAALLRNARLVQDAAESQCEAACEEILNYRKICDYENTNNLRNLQKVRSDLEELESQQRREKKRWEVQRKELKKLVNRLLKELQESPNTSIEQSTMFAEFQKITKERDTLQQEWNETQERRRLEDAEAAERHNARSAELEAVRTEMEHLRRIHDQDRRTWEQQQQTLESLIRRMASRTTSNTNMHINNARLEDSAAFVMSHLMLSNAGVATNAVAPEGHGGEFPISTLTDNKVCEDPALPPRPGMRLGKCILARAVGQGGFGNVFLGTHTVLNIPVAVKVLKLSKSEPLTSSALAEFRSEARLLAQLNHANIVRLWDYDDKGHWPYLVMEYVDGMTLLDLINQSGRIQWRRAIDIIVQAASGLLAATQLDMIHRDVKPGNILLTKDGNAKITDFGLAMFQPPNESKPDGTPRSRSARLARGTASYMAPEQARSSTSLDLRTDVYALGATFYHALTGTPPFSGNTRMELLIQQAQSDPAPVNHHVSEVPAELSGLVGRMMARNREDRTACFEEVIHELDRLRTLIISPPKFHVAPFTPQTPNPVMPATVTTPAGQESTIDTPATTPAPERPSSQKAGFWRGWKRG